MHHTLRLKQHEGALEDGESVNYNGVLREPLAAYVKGNVPFTEVIVSIYTDGSFLWWNSTLMTLWDWKEILLEVETGI